MEVLTDLFSGWLVWWLVGWSVGCLVGLAMLLVFFFIPLGEGEMFSHTVAVKSSRSSIACSNQLRSALLVACVASSRLTVVELVAMGTPYII